MFENLQALAELAKAGYKPNDIKELLELNNLQPVPEQAKDVNDDKPEKDKKPASDPEPDPIEAIIKRNEGD